MARAKPHNMGNPYGEPQPSAAPRPLNCRIKQDNQRYKSDRLEDLDGYILDGSLWTEKFLKYDYVGAPWAPNTHFTKNSGTEIRVGNGGFSLRSRKLLRTPTALDIPFSDYGTGFWHEDGFLCVHNREVLELYGIKFAPVEVAAQFSTELTVPETIKSFGGHKYI